MYGFVLTPENLHQKRTVTQSWPSGDVGSAVSRTFRNGTVLPSGYGRPLVETRGRNALSVPPKRYENPGDRVKRHRADRARQTRRRKRKYTTLSFTNRDTNILNKMSVN